MLDKTRTVFAESTRASLDVFSGSKHDGITEGHFLLLLRAKLLQALASVIRAQVDIAQIREAVKAPDLMNK